MRQGNAENAAQFVILKNTFGAILSQPYLQYYTAATIFGTI